MPVLIEYLCINNLNFYLKLFFFDFVLYQNCTIKYQVYLRTTTYFAWFQMGGIKQGEDDAFFFVGRSISRFIYLMHAIYIFGVDK